MTSGDHIRIGLGSTTGIAQDTGIILAAVDTEIATIMTETDKIAATITKIDAVKVATDLAELVVLKAAAVMVNADTLFTVAGGPIMVLGLWSECVTANDATGSTLQYSATPTSGSATTISGATSTLASVAAGTSVSLIGTALSTAPAISTGGPGLGMTAPVVVPVGTIKAVVGVGSTTGTWRHYMRYKPLASGVTVS